MSVCSVRGYVGHFCSLTYGEAKIPDVYSAGEGVLEDQFWGVKRCGGRYLLRGLCDEESYVTLNDQR
jgi:hypothetical protein